MRGRGTSRCACGGDLFRLCAVEWWSAFLHCKSKKNPFTPFTKHAARASQQARARNTCAASTRVQRRPVRTQWRSPLAVGSAKLLVSCSWHQNWNRNRESKIARLSFQHNMPSNKQKNNERAAKYQLAQEKHALDHLHNELSLAAQLLVKPQAHAGPALGGHRTTERQVDRHLDQILSF